MTKRFLPIFFVSMLFLCAYAESQEKDRRSFDTEAMENYRASGDFVYGENLAQGVDPMQYFWLRFLQFMNNLLSFEGGFEIASFLFYVVLAAILVYAIIVIFRINTTGLFSRNRSAGLNALDLHNHDIHEVDYDRLIAEAVKLDNFRVAVRLNYLHTLKIMSLSGAIKWKPWSTANDYLYQLEKKLKPDFSSLTKIFSFVWYGDFEAGKEEYTETENLKESIRTKLKADRK